MTRHTCTVRPSKRYLAPHPKQGTEAPEFIGYEVEFYISGQFIGSRFYSYSKADEKLMAGRIKNWVREGVL